MMTEDDEVIVNKWHLYIKHISKDMEPAI